MHFYCSDQDKLKTLMVSKPMPLVHQPSNPRLMLETHYGSVVIDPILISTMLSQGTRLQFPFRPHNSRMSFQLQFPPHEKPVKSSKPYITSFIMANRHIDILSSFDVVSDSSNIKSLLKLPFNPKGSLDLLVHRIGNTLLVDSIKKLSPYAGEEWWKSMQIVCNEGLNKANLEKQQLPPISSNGRLNGNNEAHTNEENDVSHEEHGDSNSNMPSALVPYNSLNENEGNNLQRAVIPSDYNNVNKENKQLKSEFNPGRTSKVLENSKIYGDISPGMFTWDFHNIQMLVGQDIPIFGDGDYPCVSLKLTDASKPINVLTGIDNWVDNLMYSVPEVAMFCHNAGIIDSYECIKTEDLPQQKDSQFDPDVVKDVTQNIIDFIKSKTTHEGHTYWLKKEKDSDYIILYDLTSLCENDNITKNIPLPHNFENAKDLNPFTVPMGLLFFALSKSLLNSNPIPTPGNEKESQSETWEERDASIAQCSQNVIKLLDSDVFADVVASAHLHIAYIHLKNIDSQKDEDISTKKSKKSKKNHTKQGSDNAEFSDQVSNLFILEIVIPS